ncbi:PREDICTED: asparagine synthetase domain-containing protein CG17486 [Drosophila arizonae]|uniref:Asparagine synthetase [glutamine-hydrolyzing] n=1 Tax=Drosophila arizonae TaxID=7263 RepID=A0ABM1PX22_DROAR|nr:PREDICTED: asparagine synthetase domain-containing protein CG17486 [Drosophila arizonae]
MCGIFCAIGQNNDVSCHLHSALEELLHNRGPDVQDKLIVDNVLLAGNVLWQQGAAPQKQPLVENDLVLLFNGDLYNLDEKKLKSEADSAWLIKELNKCNMNEDEQLLALLQQLEGPYCLILYNRREKALYFCRDALGRNSLIIERHPNNCLKLMSTSCPVLEHMATAALELPPLGLYKLRLAQLNECCLYPWQPLNEQMQQQLSTLQTAMEWSMRLGQTIAPSWLLDKLLQVSSFDLYALAAGDIPLELLHERLLGNEAVQQALSKLDELLQRSVAARVLHTAPVCRLCGDSGSGRCSHAKICILFSGGIDCSILAVLADKYVPPSEPIELINVAFERVAGAADQSWSVPDRQTSLQSLLELQRLCPQRSWQLLQVNVSREQLQQQLAAHIRQLIYPLQTVLDESLGCAFWFAAAAADSTARVALLGSGADELFGGYSRHRNAWRRAGPSAASRELALRQELEMDWQRIPARNLARDDRIIADCGKTARAPFIEEHLAQFVRSLAPQQRCCYALPEGVGDKLLLRLYGHRLGLRDATLLKKRAIQFGSRIADKRQQATQISEYLRFDSLQPNGVQ